MGFMVIGEALQIFSEVGFSVHLPLNIHSNCAENLTCQELLCSFVRQKGGNCLQHLVKTGHSDTVMGHN